MKSYVITITEIDDPDLALAELKTQMSEIILLKNTVGVVSANPEYIYTGVYTAIAKAVPFPLVGMTTISQAANGKIGTFLFSILVLTSNTCEFAYGTSDVIPKKGDVTELTQTYYQHIKSKLNGTVKLALFYAPYLEEYRCSGEYLRAIAAVDECVPVFGSLANAEIDSLFADLRTLCGEESYNDRMVMLLISGDINPSFYIGSITKEAIVMPDIGVVTESQGHCVLKINDMDAAKFFEKTGFFIGDDRNQGLLTSIFIVDKKDKDGNVVSTTSRGILSLEDEAVIFGGDVATGSILSIATTTKEMVLTTAKDAVNQIKKKHRGKTILMYSCVGRRFSLLDEPIAEYEALSGLLANSGFNYLASCSCGEICPTSVINIKAYNSEHNQSLIACVF